MKPGRSTQHSQRESFNWCGLEFWGLSSSTQCRVLASQLFAGEVSHIWRKINGNACAKVQMGAVCRRRQRRQKRQKGAAFCRLTERGLRRTVRRGIHGLLCVVGGVEACSSALRGELKCRTNKWNRTSFHLGVTLYESDTRLSCL